MLSLPHLIVLFIVALMVFGPEKLPELARTLGKAMAEFRRMTGDVRRVVEDEMREIERQVEVKKRDAAAVAVQVEAGAQTAALPSADSSSQSDAESGAPVGTVRADKPTSIQLTAGSLPDDLPSIQKPSIAKPGAITSEQRDTEPPADNSTHKSENGQDFSHVKHNPS
jgi:TatA/E family protein of Tat protein translocase